MTSLHRLVLAAVLVLAFGLRLVAAGYWQRTAEAEGVLFRLGDSHSYWTLAEHIGRGEPYQYGSEDASIFRTPLYPLLLAPMTWVGEPKSGVWLARVVGCLLGTIAVAALMQLAARLGGWNAAWAAGFLGAIYPGAIGMSIVILSEALFMPLMMAHLLLWQTAWRASSPSQITTNSLLAGCVAGAAVLTRPSWLLFLPFACCVGLMLGGNRKRHLQIFGLSAIGMCVVMCPWWIRNASITGRFVPTTLQVGPSLYDGWHAGANGASDTGMVFMRRITAQQRAADQQATGPLESTLEYRINRRALLAAINWARQHRLTALQLAGTKFMRTWSVWPDGGEIGSFAVRVLLSIGTFSVLLLAVPSSLSKDRRRWIAGICWMPCIYFTLLHMVFVGSVRYREPAVFVLAALAGCTLARLANTMADTRKRSAANLSVRAQGSASTPHS